MSCPISNKLSLQSGDEVCAGGFYENAAGACVLELEDCMRVATVMDDTDPSEVAYYKCERCDPGYVQMWLDDEGEPVEEGEEDEAVSFGCVGKASFSLACRN